MGGGGGGLILGVNTLYRLFCLLKLFLMVGKGLTQTWGSYIHITCKLPKNNLRAVVLYTFPGGQYQGFI